MVSVCLSICNFPSLIKSSAVSASIKIRVAQNESGIFWDHEVCSYVYKSTSVTIHRHKCTKCINV